MLGKAYNPFETAQAQFDHIADVLDLDQATRDLLRYPMREFHFSIPVIKVLPEHLAQNNNEPIG